MSHFPEHSSKELTSHFFRSEYGKLVAVITRYLGNNNVQTAEDIVQETLLKATEHWEIKGVPENPKAWLYTTAKNLSLNILKRQKYQRDYASSMPDKQLSEQVIPFSEELIADSQLKMMFACCHESIPENSQIALVLKILSGFSIGEIADAFFSNRETINKRLVRGRKQLRQLNLEIHDKAVLNQRLDAVLKIIYLLFNEGYLPSSKNQVIRFDLCLEAIRLAQLLEHSDIISQKTEVYALLSLMYFNVSRFQSRVSEKGEIIDLKEQDRTLWDMESIQTGSQYLQLATESAVVSKYIIMATISANHCVSTSYQTTNWIQILTLYDQLLKLEASPIIHLNRAVALAEVEGYQSALESLQQLGESTDINNYFLYYFTLAELYKKNRQLGRAQEAYHKALQLANNPRDKELLQKKLDFLVPDL
ncbi:RNA polymerase sigma factor [Flagellimonas myxillae]|uniref:RNA polymerase sigma factor n=1 Tax=Flagellimonas myxillae TaxID=2942214 RepID=UPI00201F6EF5|nr:sigma-70 family RNA polymerase sigma factor [Muricauda myxillae]MCL6265515.1 sigma-70 family RNA polymerase sigma factor [Muricauda myxillae]